MRHPKLFSSQCITIIYVSYIHFIPKILIQSFIIIQEIFRGNTLGGRGRYPLSRDPKYFSSDPGSGSVEKKKSDPDPAQDLTLIRNKKKIYIF